MHTPCREHGPGTARKPTRPPTPMQQAPQWECTTLTRHHPVTNMLRSAPQPAAQQHDTTHTPEVSGQCLKVTTGPSGEKRRPALTGMYQTEVTPMLSHGSTLPGALKGESGPEGAESHPPHQQPYACCPNPLIERSRMGQANPGRQSGRQRQGRPRGAPRPGSCSFPHVFTWRTWLAWGLCLSFCESSIKVFSDVNGFDS